MRTPSRSLSLAIFLAAIALGVPLAAWWLVGQRGAAEASQRAKDAARSEARLSAVRLAEILRTELERVRRAEDQRPWSQYQELWHDPQGTYEGPAVAPSPLVTVPSDPLVAAHLRVGADGTVEVVEGNAEAGKLLADAGPSLLEVSPRIGPTAQVQVLGKSAFYQNTQSQQVAQARQAGEMWTPPPQGPECIGVETSALAWKTIASEGNPSLVAVRRVRTPEGEMAQAVLISQSRLDELVRTSGSAAAHVEAGKADGLSRDIEEDLGLAGAAWRVVIGGASAELGAQREARRVERTFRTRFALVALLALASAAGVIGIAWNAERVAEQRSRFAASAAHELRTPLAGLQLHAEMLAEGLGDPARTEAYARRVGEEAARLGRVVSNVLGFSRLERGRLSVRAAEGDLTACVREAVERMRPALENAGCLVRMSAGDVRACFDAEAVTEILANLLDNAEKHARGARDRSIDVEVGDPDGQVAVRVRDRGPGIAPGMRRRLFEAFERGGEDGAPAGLGLGLALSRALARAMGGDLVLLADAGEGTTFELRLRAS